ncbi:hypothetical protein V5O48_019521, partial [Marasmius crinis-equi]
MNKIRPSFENKHNSVTAEDLKDAFEPHMNSDPDLPVSFNATQYQINEAIADGLLDQTEDTTMEQFFDSLFTVDEIDFAKDELERLHPGRTAAGED